jgi:hypothetical protein
MLKSNLNFKELRNNSEKRVTASKRRLNQEDSDNEFKK